MDRQLRGKLEARGNSSSHHEEYFDTPYGMKEAVVLAGIFHLLWTARCSTGLNGLDLGQMKDKG